MRKTETNGSKQPEKLRSIEHDMETLDEAQTALTSRLSAPLRQDLERIWGRTRKLPFRRAKPMHRRAILALGR